MGLPRVILGYKRFRILPTVVIGAAQKNAHIHIDVDQRIGDEFAVYDDAGRNKHFAAPFGHVLVVVIAMRWIVKRSPAAQQNAPLPDLLITGERAS